MKIIFFDFDGTITIKDSLFDFIQFAVGKQIFFIGLIRLSPMLFSYVFRLLPKDVAKERLLAYYFKGWDLSRFKEIADYYSLNRIDKIIRPKAIERIRWHQAHGDKVVIVSASLECWLKSWCIKNNINLISTKFEMEGNILTGRFSTKNCYGQEKINRIKELYNLCDYDQIYAYGDSRGDKEMLNIAHKQYYKYFDRD